MTWVDTGRGWSPFWRDEKHPKPETLWLKDLRSLSLPSWLKEFFKEQNTFFTCSPLPPWPQETAGSSVQGILQIRLQEVQRFGHPGPVECYLAWFLICCSLMGLVSGMHSLWLAVYCAGSDGSNTELLRTRNSAWSWSSCPVLCNRAVLALVQCPQHATVFWGWGGMGLSPTSMGGGGPKNAGKCN